MELETTYGPHSGWNHNIQYSTCQTLKHLVQCLEHSFVDFAQQLCTPATSGESRRRRRFRRGMMDGKNEREPQRFLSSQRLNNNVAAATGGHVHGEDSL